MGDEAKQVQELVRHYHQAHRRHVWGGRGAR